MGRTRKFKNLALASSLVLSASMITSCTKAPRDYDILSDASEFVQNTVHTPRKVDILWVVDNSGSMATSQDNVAKSFQSFIGRFRTLNYDFHMGVTTTDAYKTIYYPGTFPNSALLRDGNPTDGPSGYPILSNTLPDQELSDAFIKNIMQGTKGSGDERAFQSIGATLVEPRNSGFHRDGAFLAVIMVMDEEDYSHDSAAFYDKNKHTLHDPQMYIDFLASVTGGEAGKDFSFNSISIDSQECLDSLTDGFLGRTIAHRARALADATEGVTASLCDDFGGSLELISDSIVELSSVFKLDREPNVSSILVYIDGVSVPQSDVNGWTYLPDEIAIRFNGTAVPPQGASVRIDFDPLELKN